jgi:hypothetical protein
MAHRLWFSHFVQSPTPILIYQPKIARYMKCLYYLGGVLLAGVLLVVWPSGHTTTAALAAEVVPSISQWQPSQIAATEFNGSMIIITGSQWPDEAYGLTAVLRDLQTDRFIALETVSYTPAAGRMVAKIPWHSNSPAGIHYDLMLMTRNGTHAVASQAIAIVDDTLSPAPESSTPEEESETPPVTPTAPTSEIVLDTDAAPAITTHSPAVITTDLVGSALIITGQGWPEAAYGLNVYLRQHGTDKVFHATTISYTPQAGRLVVQLPSLPQDSNIAYDIVISTINGARTTIVNGLWVTDGS